MENWNVSSQPTTRGTIYHLMNYSKTMIVVDYNVNVDIASILSALEEISFPLKYTRGLKLIRFTKIRGNNSFGDYCDDIVRVDVRPRRKQDKLIETIVHEIAHHIDSDDEISSMLTDERKVKGKSMHWSATNDGEYFARGFEKFYSQNKQDKTKLRKEYPKLYKTIRLLHKEFSSK